MSWLPTQASEIHADEVRVTGRADDDLAFFEGHFPGMPIFPGVGQIEWAERCARIHFEPDGPCTTLRKIKFQSLIRPGRMLYLTLSRKPGSATVTFRIESDDGPVSSGQLDFDGTPE